jgi:hypothetical protein
VGVHGAAALPDSGVATPALPARAKLPAHAAAARRWPGYVAAASLVAAVVSAGAAAAYRELEASPQTVPPDVARVAVSRVFIDDTPVPLTVRVGWTHVPFVATADSVRSDETLWRRMDFSDWDRVPAPLREEALHALLARYDHLFASPHVWDGMTAHDWDRVPQPVRALAYRHMAEYWSGFYKLGAAYGIPPGLAANTLSAVLMSESWFEHRAVAVASDGTEDRGVAQASAFARRRMEELHRAGRVEVAFAEHDYFDPWHGARFAALWLGLMLDEMKGDLEAAVRAYHRGAAAAFDSTGDGYLERVLRRRRQFIENRNSPPAWNYLWERDEILVAAAWPWVGSQRETSGRGEE